jgi:hypothetical protein
VSGEPNGHGKRRKLNDVKSVVALSQLPIIALQSAAVKQPNCRHDVFRWSLRNTGEPQ